MNDFDDMTEAEMLDEAERIAICSRATYDQANAAIDEAWDYYCAARRDKLIAMVIMVINIVLGFWVGWHW